jgi:hypothetical protein
MPSTTKSLGVFRSHLADPEGRPAPTDRLPDEDRIGIVFVHGIGSQKAGETLLQWSGPIIEVLTDWSGWPSSEEVGRTFPAATAHDPHDPVFEAAIDLESTLPTITLRIPATSFADQEVPFPAKEWVMTEAWWASKVSPPGLSTMTSWLGPGGAAGRIVDAILRNSAADNKVIGVARAFIVPFVTVLAALILSLYALTRTIIAVIPIQAVKDAAILRVFDEFLIGWFGDARILLYDPAQSANIRAGLADAVRRLRTTCSRVVVMAHSGGAMVSYLTLTDPALRDVRVDKLITFGEGWNLALRLTDDGGGMADRLRQDIFDGREELRWRDFHASHDPAPAGAVDTGAVPGLAEHHQLRSTEVWNRRSVLDDHGGYWDNDEEFTIPVLRELDIPDAWGDRSRFYRPDATPGAPPPPLPSPPPNLPDDPRAQRHQQRVALLALWRHTVVLFGVATVALAVRFAPQQLIGIGTWISELLPDDVPVVSDVIRAISAFSLHGIDNVQLPIPLLGSSTPGVLADAVQWLGIGVLQAVILISAFYLMAAGPGSFRAWPSGSKSRRITLVIEALEGIGVVACVLTLLVEGDHQLLLGNGLTAWIPGLAVTFGVLVVTWIGTEIATILRGVTVAAHAYAVVASAIFIVALASSVVAIFRVPDVIDSEFAYVTIWVGAYILLTVGRARWGAWDRVERQVARGAVGAIEIDRRPVIFTSGGLLSAAFALMGLVLAWPPMISGGLVLLAAVLILMGIAYGAIVWHDPKRPNNPVSSPGPVEYGGA